MPTIAISNDEIPIEITAQVDVLYEALARCPDLLKVGRRHGLRVGLTNSVVELMRKAHGDEVNAVVSNCLSIADI